MQLDEIALRLTEALVAKDRISVVPAKPEKIVEEYIKILSSLDKAKQNIKLGS